jgi:hypothetical protein
VVVVDFKKMLKIKPIPTPKGNEHPKVPSSVLPQHEFTLGLIAPKGKGKTTTILNLIDFYSKPAYFHSILIFSPTVKSDEKWKYLKNKKVLAKNVKLAKFAKDMIARDKKSKAKGLVERPKADDSKMQHIVDKIEEYTGVIPEDCYFEDYDDATFQSIMDEQFAMVKLLEENDISKHTANRILVIFDDLVGSALFKSEYFKGFNTRHRHYSVSVMMVSQGYKEIEKTIRTNFTALIIYGIGNEMEIRVIYEEYAMELKYKDWLEIYRYCTNEFYSFMYLNMYTQEKEKQIMKNFEEYVSISNKRKREEE